MMKFTISIGSGNFDQFEELLENLAFCPHKDEGELPTIYLDDLTSLIMFVREVSIITNDQADIIISRNDNVNHAQISNHIRIQDIHAWTPRSNAK